jgi:hypothetical protein
VQLRGAKEKVQVAEAELKKANKKVLELQSNNDRLEALAKANNLEERDVLLRQVRLPRPTEHNGSFARCKTSVHRSRTAMPR